jgi:hypothetical protein
LSGRCAFRTAAAAAKKAGDVPAWLYLLGAAVIFGVVMFAPGVLDWISDLISDRMVGGINDMQNTTTTTTP